MLFRSHSREPYWDGIRWAPKGVLLETRGDIAKNARLIYLQSGMTNAMPPANVTFLEPDDGAAAARNLLLGRLTEAEDIAGACAFLLSDDARQITGQILDVDGGNHLMGGGWTPMTDDTIQGRIP